MRGSVSRQRRAAAEQDAACRPARGGSSRGSSWCRHRRAASAAAPRTRSAPSLLGRDHVARDRDDAAPLPWRGAAGVAVGRHHERAAPSSAPAEVATHEAGMAIARDALHRRPRRPASPQARRAAAARALRVLRGVQRRPPARYAARRGRASFASSSATPCARQQLGRARFRRVQQVGALRERRHRGFGDGHRRSGRSGRQAQSMRLARDQRVERVEARLRLVHQSPPAASGRGPSPRRIWRDPGCRRRTARRRCATTRPSRSPRGPAPARARRRGRAPARRTGRRGRRRSPRPPPRRAARTGPAAAAARPPTNRAWY